MKLHVKKSTTIAGLCLSALVGLAIIPVVIDAVTQPAQAQVEGGRLITVHDRGVETAFITTAKTLSEALAEQNIELDTKDAVEPALDEQLVAQDYQVNIYRARPVTIIDGAMRQKVVTPYQSAERIVADAGIDLEPEDTTTLERSDDIVGDGAGLQLTIDRATEVTLDLYGTKTGIRTQAETVGDMLREKSIDLGDSGRASLALDTLITEGMNVRIWREGKQTITVSESVDFKTKQVEDADREVGYKEVQTAGKNGQRTVTYEIDIKDGREVARTEIASIVTKEPETQVEVIGTKVKTLAYAGGGSKSDWLAASNIPESDWGYADFMVQKESGWNPNAMNASSGACGIPQALPCSKLGANWNDPVVGLNWMHSYVNGRYGGWAGAYNFWLAHHWY